MTTFRERPLVTPENRPYTFVDPKPEEWQRRHEYHASFIGATLGDHVLGIEHVGGTAIPNIPGKDQTDALVIVKSIKDIPKYYEAMQEGDYTSHGPYAAETEEYFTHDNDAGLRTAGIHIVEEGDPWANELLLFRDYLRTSEMSRIWYRATKEEAHQFHPDDYPMYHQHKQDMTLELLAEAQAWHDAGRQS
ncbi:MAG TPA: GrpB family protein [Candidatus Saccharimonadales bacterium]|nr:GrpB family protein [Candidatus Saccharimonadales bacterium]